jgi:hypothetical protein
MKTKLILTLTALLAFSQAPFTQAAEKPKAKADEKAPAKAEAKPKEETYPLYGKVVAVTSRTLTIVRSESEEAKETKFSIGSSTEIVNGDKPATIEDVKVGQWIGGLVRKAAGDGNDFVTKINVGVKQKKSPGKETKATPKKTDSAPKKKES